MSDSAMRDRYLELIDQIVQMTLQGKIRSKEQVYQLLVQDLDPGTVEIFEQCLTEQSESTRQQVNDRSNEFKQAKATRILRALQTIQGEWQRWQEQNQVTSAIAGAVQQILTAERTERLAAFLRVTEPNRNQLSDITQLKQLAKALAQSATQVSDPDLQQDVQQIATGITRGLESWGRLQDHLVSWIYDQGRGLGFEGVPGQRGPWAVWEKQSTTPLLRGLFHTLALERSLTEFIPQAELELETWVELNITLQYLQQGLVSWFDKLVYDTKVGAKLSISTFLAFAVLWSQLATGFSQTGQLTMLRRQQFTDGCFQVTLQILRIFAQRAYFPLYGGIFASFSGGYLRDTLNYLDEPLRRAEGTQEKARILTLLGSSFRAQGGYDRATEFYEQALSIAREAGDRPCEVAALNHLSRTCVAQKLYGEAINHSQRALILSRQAGDRLGEANALTNLGYSEVFQAQQQEQVASEVYESAISYLQQGLELSERLGDNQSQAWCLSSLGIAHVVLEQAQMAIAYLERGTQAAQASGDIYLQGLDLAYLAEAHYRLENWDQAVYLGCLGMYLLEQIASRQWRQPASLLTVLKGKMGAMAFQAAITQYRPQIIAVIGVDGYDHLPQLLNQY